MYLNFATCNWTQQEWRTHGVSPLWPGIGLVWAWTGWDQLLHWTVFKLLLLLWLLSLESIMRWLLRIGTIQIKRIDWLIEPPAPQSSSICVLATKDHRVCLPCLPFSGGICLIISIHHHKKVSNNNLLAFCRRVDFLITSIHWSICSVCNISITTFITHYAYILYVHVCLVVLIHRPCPPVVQ